MKKIVKNIFSLVLACTVILGVTFLPTDFVFAQANGFVIDNNNVLTGYTGTGGIVKIPNGVKTIGKKAFAGSGVISKIEMPDSVTTIETGAFDSCHGLTEISFSKNLKTIGDNAFWGCTVLKNITLPSGLKTIGFGAFANCDALTGVNIPSSVSSIGNYAFGYLYYGDYVPALEFTIMGEKNTSAQTYADKYSIPFVTRDSIKTSLSSVSKKSGNKMVVKWKKNTKVSGYEIQYSTSNKFATSKTKTIHIGKPSVTSKTITKIPKGKTYYVRMRGYRTISGKKYYSSWGIVLKK